MRECWIVSDVVFFFRFVFGRRWEVDMKLIL